MPNRQAEGLALAKRAAIHLFNEDPEFVVGGCSDISEIISAWLRRKGIMAVPIYGFSRYGKQRWFMHAWLDIEGEVFDPVLWVQGRKMAKYQYKEEPDIAAALRCDVEYIIEGEVEGLDKEIT